MSSTLELRSALTDYLNRRTSLAELEMWLVPRLPMYLEVPESPVNDLVVAIELALAELHDGLRSQRSLRRELAVLLREVQQTAWVPYPEESARTSIMTTCSNSEPVIAGDPLNRLPFWSIEQKAVA